MADGPDELRQAFKRLKDSVLPDLRGVLRIEHKPPVYAAAILVAVGCEALGRLRHTHISKVFVEELVLKRRPDIDERMAVDLFEALRNGLAHIYDTAYIQAGSSGPRIELIICWKNHEQLHLRPRRYPPGIYLHLPTMFEDLKAAFRKHDVALADGRWQAQALPALWKNVISADDRSIKRWRQFLAE